MNTETATFGAGCFWGVQARFDEVLGVVETEVGYAGGTTEHPTYEDVCTGSTGHAEVVRVQFDPNTLSYEKLLDTFWGLHDPTQMDRQGPDVGRQYRSVILTHSPEQRAAAAASRERLNASGKFTQPIATVIEDAGPFWRAEEYHQKYEEKTGRKVC